MVHLSDYRRLKAPINEKMRQINLPGSKISENTRRNNVMVKVDLDNSVVDFKAKTDLSGQFSTLTRGLYQYDHKHETINELYSKKIWEINNQVELTDHQTKVANKEFPFQTTVTAHFSANNLMHSSNDTVTLSLKNWFNHIIYPDFNISNRQMDFYPDFMGTDSYVYLTQFNKNIKLLKDFEKVDIKNDFGRLTISLEQAGPNMLKISSYFAVAKKKVSVENIKNVKDIYQEIQKLNNSSIQFYLE